MPGKVITTEFQIRGGVDSGFITSMTRATERTQQLKEEINSIESTLKIAKQFEAYEQKIRNTDEKLRALTAGTAEYIRTAAAAQKYADTFADLMQKLERAGVNTGDLTAETARLNGELSKTTTILNGMGRTIEAEAAELRKLSQEYANFSAQYRQMFSDESARVGRTYATYINTANANGVYTIPGEGNVDYGPGTISASMAHAAKMKSIEDEWASFSAEFNDYWGKRTPSYDNSDILLKSNNGRIAGLLNGLGLGGIASGLTSTVLPGLLIGYAIRGTYGFAKSSVTESMSLEQIMSEVRAYTTASEAQTRALRDTAKDIGLNTVFSAQEAARAMTYLGKAGWSTSDINSGIRGVMSLAAASGEDLSSVSSIVADALGAFRLSPSDSQRFADVLAKTATRSNTDVGLIGDTFSTAAPVAGALGYSIEDVAQMIGLMANVGIKGSRAGTSTRNILNAFASGFTVNGAAIGEYTYTSRNTDGTLKSLRDTLDELRAVFTNLTGDEQVSMANEIAGMRGYAGLLAILNASDEEYNRLSEEIAASSGTAAEMAATRLDNLAGDAKLLSDAFLALKTEVGEVLTPAIRVAAQTGTTLLTNATNNLKSDRAIFDLYRIYGQLHGFVDIDAANKAEHDILNQVYDDPNYAIQRYLLSIIQSSSNSVAVATARRLMEEYGWEEYIQGYSMSEAHNSHPSPSGIKQVAEAEAAAIDNLAASYAKLYEEARETLGGMFKLWTQVEGVVPTDVYDVMDALGSQADYWNSYSSNLANLYARESSVPGLTAMISSYADGSADSAALFAGLAGASDAELRAMMKMYDAAKYAEENASSASAAVQAGTVFNITINAEGATDAAIDRLESFAPEFAERVANAIRQIESNEDRVSLYD